MPQPATTLNGAITAGATAATVRDALGFPSSSASGPFKVLIDTEVLSVGAGHGTTAWSSITRGVDGTTAAAHSDGATVTLVPEAYATIDDVLATFDSGARAQIAGDTAKLGRLTDLLGVASDEITQEVGHHFYRSPRVSGTQTRILRSPGGRSIHLHGRLPGLAAVPTLVEFASSWGGTFTTIASADLLAEQHDPASGQYDHLTLAGTSSGYGAFPNGAGLLRITSAFDFPAVPANVRQATVDRVRQLFAADPSVVGGVIGPSEAGVAQVLPRMPDTTWRVIEHYRRRYASCWVS